jgi:hypothetical protein
MFDCIVFCGPETVVERDPQLLSLALYTLSTGGLGMLLARRRPVLSALFISFVLLSAFAVYLEVRACYVGESILRMSGYISGSALVILVGISLSVLGALVGAQKVDERTRAWRWTSGLSGIALLGLTLFAGYQLGGLHIVNTLCGIQRYAQGTTTFWDGETSCHTLLPRAF